MRRQRTFKVYVVVRHCRGGSDERVGVFDSPGWADQAAQSAAERAAHAYGEGYVSVFHARLVFAGRSLGEPELRRLEKAYHREREGKVKRHDAMLRRIVKRQRLRR